MKTVLLAAIGTLGDIEPFISFAHAFKSLNVRPILVVNSQWVNHVQKFDLEVHSIGDVIPVSPTTAAKKEADPAYGYGFSKIWRDWGVPCTEKTYNLILKLIEDTQPFAVISHYLSIGSAWAAAKAELPYSIVLPQPGSVVLTQSKDYKKGPLLLAVLRRCNFFLKKTCEELGVEWRASLWEDTIYQANSHLGFWSPTLGIPSAERFPKLTVCGFPELMSDPCPEDVQAFLDEGEPPIAFGLGTSAVNIAGSFFQDAIQVCRELDCRGIFFCGNNIPPFLPNRILGVKFAPYSKVFPQCKAIVHHGGINTCANAIKARRPMVIVPYGADQLQNAGLLEHFGVSITLGRGQENVKTLTRSLEKVLTSEYQQRAEDIGSKVCAEPDGALVAANKILEDFGGQHLSGEQTTI